MYIDNLKIKKHATPKDAFEEDIAGSLDYNHMVAMIDSDPAHLKGLLFSAFRLGWLAKTEELTKTRSEYHRQYYLKRKNGQAKPKTKATPKKKPTPKKKTTLPDDAVLTDDNRRKALAYWETRGCRRDADHEWQRFCSLHWAKANMYVDWDQAWVTWYINAVDYGKELKEMY